MNFPRADALEALKGAAADHIKRLFQVRMEAAAGSAQDVATANERFTNGVSKLVDTYRDTYEIVKRKIAE